MCKQQKGRKFNRISENSGADVLAAGTGFHYLKGQLLSLLPRAYRMTLVPTQPRKLRFLIGAKFSAITTPSNSITLQ
jgi:hypothetical protein